MNTPRVPDDQNNWDSIEIFLFSNGEQYSPPRKYHLESEELKWWDATLSNLARSQFGSLYSTIDLYTLNGKKIVAPLELINDAAYVAVKSPDVFVQTGYEEYLIKATRSREKRQERIKNTETAKSANSVMNKEQLKSNLNILNDKTLNAVKIEDSLILETEKEYLALVTDNTFSQKDTEKDIQTKNNNPLKPATPVWLQKRKPRISTNNTINKRNDNYVKNNNGGQSIRQRKNSYFPKKIVKSSNKIKSLTTSSSNTAVLKTNLKSKTEQKDKVGVPKIFQNALEINKKNELLKNEPATENSLQGSYNKDLTVDGSDVYKNTEHDIQSVFLDVDQNTALLNKEHDLENTEELSEKPTDSLNTNKVMSKQSVYNLTELKAMNNISNQPAVFNLYLRINLSGCTVFNNQDKEDDAFKCNSSYLIKLDKGTQVDVDIKLGSDHLKYVSDIPKTSDKFCFSRPCSENVDNTRVILINCKCNPFEEDGKATSRNSKETDNCLFPTSTNLNDQLIQRGNHRRLYGKETQDSLLHSCIRIPASNSEMMLLKKHESAAKHKVSITQEAPRELNSDIKQQKSPEDMQNKKIKVVISVYKSDNSTQTDWCNVLLQAKFHEDGHYTFHIPPLQLLKHYNLL